MRLLGRATHALSEVLSYLAQADCGICTDSRLLIIGGTCEELEQITVDDTVAELVDDWQNSLDRLLSDDGCGISEAGGLQNMGLASKPAGVCGD